MEQNINKEELKNYLLETMKIELIIINNFLDLIYDDNEEDKNNVPTNHFLEKYISLLKILDTNESEEENKEKNQKDNSINEEEINKIEFGSPIRDNLINKYEDDNSIDPSELFKEMNFKNNYENNFENKNFNSIIRPSKFITSPMSNKCLFGPDFISRNPTSSLSGFTLTVNCVDLFIYVT